MTPESTSPYLMLKHAQAMFERNPDTLDASEQARLLKVVTQQQHIEACILSQTQAQGIVIDDAALARSLQEIRARYADEAEFSTALACHHLSPDALREALRRELHVEATLERVAAAATPVSTVDVEVFYRLHRERFRMPERRRVRHILITLNDSLSGHDRAAVSARMTTLLNTLANTPDSFGTLALRYSECPSALNGGLIGNVTRGQLFPALDEAAFTMEAGTIAGPFESTMGLHILFCEAVQSARLLPLRRVRERIASEMQQARRDNLTRAWIRGCLARMPVCG